MKNCPSQSCIAALLVFTHKVRLYYKILSSIVQPDFTAREKQCCNEELSYSELHPEKSSAALKNCPLHSCIAALKHSSAILDSCNAAVHCQPQSESTYKRLHCSTGVWGIRFSICSCGFLTWTFFHSQLNLTRLSSLSAIEWSVSK